MLLFNIFFLWTWNIIRQCVKLLQVYPSLCDPMDYSLPGSSVRGISQAKILEWVAVASSREPSQLTDRTQVLYVFYIGSWSFYHYHLLGSPITRQYWDQKSSICCLCALPNLSGKIFTATGRVNSHTHIHTVFWII